MTTGKSVEYQKFSNHDGVLHCHHYNCFLQRTIQDPGYIDPDPLLKKAAALVAMSHMNIFFANNPAKNSALALEIGAALCKDRGFGILDLSGVNEKGGRVVSSMSHYGFGWLKKFGKSSNPVCHFLAGYIRGILSAAFQKEFTVAETLCRAKGDGRCIFEVYEGADDAILGQVNVRGQVATVTPPPITQSGNLDVDSITSAVSGLGLVGNEEGIIDAFNVYLASHYGDYYNRISFGFEQQLEAMCSVEGLAQPLLVEAGHVCGFNTFGGIMKSPEWYALVAQNARNREDWVHGMVAVINALGWGTWRIAELKGNERLVIRTYNSYEAVGYQQHFGQAKVPKCYMAQGTTSAIMNLIYLGNIDKKPELTDAFYENLFSGEDSFFSIETKCQAKGDDCCEFVVERAQQ